jgi:hypothetical protein
MINKNGIKYLNDMKTLKFRPYLVPLILNKTKDKTWRLFDDKDITVGDDVVLLDKETLAEFAKAKITNVSEKKLMDLDEEDWEGHEKFDSEDEMLTTFSLYYNSPVNRDTRVKIIKFELF